MKDFYLEYFEIWRSLGSSYGFSYFFNDLENHISPVNKRDIIGHDILRDLDIEMDNTLR